MEADSQILHTPKSIELLRILEEWEYQSFKDSLVKKKKLRLLILSEILWDKKELDFNTELRGRLFQKLYADAYSKDKDYLLRNEFRMLNDELEKYLVKNEINEEVENNENSYNYYLLRALQDRKALNLFKKEYQDAYEQAVENADYYAAHNITGLNFINYTQFLNLNEKDIQFVKQLNDLKLTHLSCYYLTAFRTHQIDSEFTRTFLYPFSIHELSPLKEVKVDFGQYENDYSGYLYMKARSFLVPHKERIRLLLICLDFVKEQPLESIMFQREMRFCLSMLAKAHSLNFEFEKAAIYFEDFFNLKMERDDPERLAMLCEYLTKLIKLEEYDKAIALITENKSEINTIEKLRFRLLCLETATYAFRGEKKVLFDLLPQSFKGYGKHLKNFFRFYHSVHAFMNGELEEAYRETQNMKKSNRKIELEFDIREILKFFDRFFYAMVYFLPEGNKRQSQLKKLSADIQKYDLASPPEYKSYLPFLWLKKQLVMDDEMQIAESPQIQE